MTKFKVNKKYLCTKDLYMRPPLPGISSEKSFTKNKSYLVIDIIGNRVVMLDDNKHEHGIGQYNINDLNGNWWRYFIEERIHKFKRILNGK